MTRPPAAGVVDVETTAGTLRGIASPRVTALLGVPYAAPVSGAGRFLPPRPAEPWRGLRVADAFGPGSPQVDPRLSAGEHYYRVLRLLYPGVPSPLEGRPSDEDSLVLNVWTPGADEARRPVMVWLHGGGFVHGTGAEGWFQGDRLAELGDVVVVTLNHRLGALGFLGAGEGEQSASGIAGMLDIVEALRWVRDNAAAVGGDPGNVTVFGQSGGGGKVATLLAMPAAAGLFHRAIIQSGPFTRAIEPEHAAGVRAEFVAALAAGGTTPETAPVSAVLEVQADLVARHGMAAFGPTLHPLHLPAHPFDAAAPALADGIPLMVGTTTHEFSLMLSEHAWYHSMSDEELPARLAAVFPDDATAALEAYRELEGPDAPPQLLLARATSDIVFGAPSDALRSLKATQSAPVYSYRFDYRTEVLGGILGAHHSLDLPFVFANTDRSPVTGDRPVRHEVAARMALAWASFARTGHPGIAGWAEFSSGAAQHVFAEVDVEESAAPRPRFRTEFGL
ncbi:MAG: carboxylesterase family protein [Microbacteriaceae bacterium]